MPAYTSCPWSRDLQPQFWTKYQVWEWLQQVMDIHQIDASSVPFQNFDMDGHQLCNLNYQDFVHAAGSVGPILFHSITELKWGGTSGGEWERRREDLDLVGGKPSWVVWVEQSLAGVGCICGGTPVGVCQPTRRGETSSAIAEIFFTEPGWGLILWSLSGPGTSLFQLQAQKLTGVECTARKVKLGHDLHTCDSLGA